MRKLSDLLRDTAGWSQSEEELREALRSAAEEIDSLTPHKPDIQLEIDMSSIHNDLHSWAGKARAHGNDTIVITADLADKAADIIVEQANRIAELEQSAEILKKIKNKAMLLRGDQAYREFPKFVINIVS